MKAKKFTTKVYERDIFFFSFKGDAKVSTLDQVSLPPPMGMMQGVGGNWHAFGEWLKRMGYSVDVPTTDEQICKWSIEYFNITVGVLSWSKNENSRRFDRMAKPSEI